MMREEITGVILAAGRGTRMFPFTTRWPKPILPIMGKPLLKHQIELLRSVGIRKIFMVIGYLGYEVVQAIGDGSDLGVDIEYVEQTEMLGIAHAVGRLEARVRGPFVLCLGDIFFVSDRLNVMIEEFWREDTKAVLASKVEDRPDMIGRNFAIVVAEGNNVVRVIEKPRYVQNRLKGCGIYCFAPEIFDAIRRTPRTAMRDEYEITEAIQIMINDGLRVVHADIIQEDLNLTVPDDLLMINMAELQRLGLENYFASGGESWWPQKMAMCVVGKAVNFEGPCMLRNCVIFDHATVPACPELKNAITAPDGIVQCNVWEADNEPTSTGNGRSRIHRVAPGFSAGSQGL
jgi:dTDP-glucose pyrophosphorylase